uniref:BAR domain-containing protein n=1 Tax=Parascaris univalens TaxID=6257 RepID=A0A915BZ45_PARUN
MSKLFSRVRYSVLLRLGRTQETSYPPEVIAQMNLLPIIRDLADDVQRCVDAIATKFHLEEGSSASNVSENFAMPLKILVEHISDHNEYAEFLKTQCELYDDIGQIQRNLHTGLQDLVLNPLRTFIITDFDRIMREITTLNERRRDMDIAADEAKRGSAETKMQRTFKAEQTKRDYEMQFALVKVLFHLSKSLLASEIVWSSTLTGAQSEIMALDRRRKKRTEGDGHGRCFPAQHRSVRRW